MGRPLIYSRRLRVYVTAEQLAEINREMTLTGSNLSDIVRAALTAHFDNPARTKKRRAS